MPIVGRQLGSRPIAVPRSDDDDAVGEPAPPEDLLPSGGARPIAAAPAPHRALALDALQVIRALRDHPRAAEPWSEPAFARDVELVRGHLAPIRSRRALSASFSREASLANGTQPVRDPVLRHPLRLAYALRWLELGDGIARAGWIELVTDRD